MSENNEEILANFQSITAIEDVAEAIFHLEESNWDLLTAVHRVLPQDTESQGYSAFHQPVPQQPIFHQQSSLPLHVIDDNVNDFDIVSNVDVQMSVPYSPAKATQHRNIYGSDFSSSLSESSKLPIDMIGDYNNGGGGGGGVGASGSAGSSSSSSSSSTTAAIRHKAKNVIFNIHFKYEVHKIIISDHADVAALKTKIMDATGVPVCRQALTGWLPREEPCTNSTILHQLNVVNENELILTDLTEEGFIEDANDLIQRLNESFTLIIKHLPNNHITSLQFPGRQTILEVKTNVYSLTSIPVRYQEWIGWPLNITNQTTLAQSGIGLVHNLELRSNEPQHTTTQPHQQRLTNTSATTTSVPQRGILTANDTSNTIEIDTSDSSVDEFEDASDFNADDDLFTDTTVRNRINYLIPDDIDDEKIGSIQFIDNYLQRYGDPHPDFFRGSLEEALNTACHKPAKDRKLLAIYMHHDGSVLTNVFCDQLLKCESIMQILYHNFILYGWDLTFESNKNLFLSSILACSGTTATITVRNIAINQLPAILIIGKSRSTCEVLSVIYGNVSKDELLNKLIDTINMYSDQRDIEVREENDRAAREQVKMEQDVAYNESLEADRRKEAARQQKENALATERKRIESERQEIEAIREANRLDAEQCVPPEPSIDADGVTKIRVRKPTGEYFERRFNGNNKLLVLLKFVASKGFPIDEYKVISSYPRRDLTTVNTDETLEKLKLCPQETVTLEER